MQIKKFAIVILTVVLTAATLMPCSLCAPAGRETELSRVAAKGAVLLDASDGSAGVLWEKNSHARLPMASTTKIMTALVAIENLPLSTVVNIPAAAVGIEGSSVYLCEGEHQTLESLLYALMLESANDAATAIAIEVAGSVEKFAVMMNERAAVLGLCDTHFVNPHGLDDPDHYTSAYDLALIAREAFRNPDFRKIAGTYRSSMPLGSSDGARLLINHNRLLRTYPGAVGGKTGFTKKSGRCLVTAAERDGLMLISVTLSDPNDWDDHTKMLDFGFSGYENILLAVAGELEYPVSVTGGEQSTVIATNLSDVRTTLPRSHGDIGMSVMLSKLAAAPVRRGDRLGTVTWTCDGSEIAAAELSAEYNAAKATNKKFNLLEWLLSLFGLEI